MVHTIVLRTHTPCSSLKSKIQFPRARVHIQLEPNPSGRTYKKTIFLENLKNTAERYRLFKESSLQAISSIEASLLSGARKYFEENLFVEVTVPHVTRATGACENVATMFEVDFFGQKRYLTQTGQLYLEVMTPYLEKVWAAGPSFRAEDKVDDRHLVEFTLLEIEFRGNFEQLLEHVEGTLVSMVSEVLAKRSEGLAVLGVDAERLQNVRRPFKEDNLHGRRRSARGRGGEVGRRPEEPAREALGRVHGQSAPLHNSLPQGDQVLQHERECDQS